MISWPVSSVPIGIVLTPRGSIERELLVDDELVQARLCRSRSRSECSHFSASPSPRAMTSSASSIVAVKRVVDEMAEVPLEQVRDRERGPRGNERGALAPHVRRGPGSSRSPPRTWTGGRCRAPRAPSRGSPRCSAPAAWSRAPTDASSLHATRSPSTTDGQTRFRSRPRRPRRRLRCTRGASRGSRTSCPTARNVARSPCGRRRAEADRHLAAARVGHLARDRADPDQLVEAALVGVELGAHLVGRADAIAGGTDRLVRLLRVLHLAAVRARLGRAGTPRRTARGSRCGPR